MVDRRIYAGYYRRYDGKLIYVVTTAKDTDTDEDVVIWTPNVYSEKHAYYTMSKRSFCESILADGVRQPKFKRQTQMRIAASGADNFEEDGFSRPTRKADAHIEDGCDDWHRPSAASYQEYAKKLCEGYRFSRAKYARCVNEKRYIGISKEDFRELKSNLLFLQNCLKTVLGDYAGYFEERFVKGLSIRKYAQAHALNRGSVDHLQRKFFAVLAQALKERDEADDRNRLRGEYVHTNVKHPPKMAGAFLCQDYVKIQCPRISSKGLSRRQRTKAKKYFEERHKKANSIAYTVRGNF